MHKLSLHERSVLKELCDILSSFETATNYTKGDQIITSSFGIPCIRGLKNQLFLMNKNNNKIINAFMESLKNDVRLIELNAVFKMAAIMDPRFKLAWCQDEEAASLRCMLQNETASLTPLQTVEQSSSLQAEPPKERCKLFSFMKDNALVTSQIRFVGNP